MSAPLFALNVLCGVAMGMTLLTLASLFWIRRRPVTRPASFPPLLILRPCEGAEPGLYENLLTVAYPGPRRVLLLVPDETDPAWPVARAVAEAAPAIEIIATRPGGARNRKVAQLTVGLSRSAGEPVIIQADSDVRLRGDDLIGLVTALLAHPQNGAAFASPAEVAPQTLWDRASSAMVTASQQNFLALYAMSRITGGVPSLAGPLFALARGPFADSGGLAGLEDVLGEDYEIGRRLCAAGYRVDVSRGPARCTDGSRSLRQVIGRIARWQMVVRGQRPGLLLLYPPLICAAPLHLLLAGLIRQPAYLAMALSLLGLRTVLAFVLRRIHEVSGPSLLEIARSLVAVLAAELLLWAGLVRATVSRRIVWRGHRYVVGRGGRLVPVDPEK
jgi:ceramide glucosyltransferase